MHWIDPVVVPLVYFILQASGQAHRGHQRDQEVHRRDQRQGPRTRLHLVGEAFSASGRSDLWAACPRHSRSRVQRNKVTYPLERRPDQAQRRTGCAYLLHLPVEAPRTEDWPVYLAGTLYHRHLPLWFQRWSDSVSVTDREDMSRQVQATLLNKIA